MWGEVSALDVAVDVLVVFLKLAIPSLPAFEPRLRCLSWRRSRVTAAIASERKKASPDKKKLRRLQSQFAAASEEFLAESHARSRALRRHSGVYLYVLRVLSYLIVGRLLSQIHFLLYLKPFRDGRDYVAVLPPSWVRNRDFREILAIGVRSPVPGAVGYLAFECCLFPLIRPLVKAMLPPYDSLGAQPGVLKMLWNLRPWKTRGGR